MVSKPVLIESELTTYWIIESTSFRKVDWKTMIAFETSSYWKSTNYLLDNEVHVNLEGRHENCKFKMLQLIALHQ